MAGIVGRQSSQELRRQIGPAAAIHNPIGRVQHKLLGVSLAKKLKTVQEANVVAIARKHNDYV